MIRPLPKSINALVLRAICVSLYLDSAREKRTIPIATHGIVNTPTNVVTMKSLSTPIPLLRSVRFAQPHRIKLIFGSSQVKILRCIELTRTRREKFAHFCAGASWFSVSHIPTSGMCIDVYRLFAPIRLKCKRAHKCRMDRVAAFSFFDLIHFHSVHVLCGGTRMDIGYCVSAMCVRVCSLTSDFLVIRFDHESEIFARLVGADRATLSCIL